MSKPYVAKQRFARDSAGGFARQKVATVSKGSRQFPATTSDGKNYLDRGIDMGEFMRIETRDPSTGNPFDASSAARLESSLPVIDFVGVRGQYAYLASDKSAPSSPTFRWSCHAVTLLKFQLPSVDLTKVIQVRNTEAASSIGRNGKPSRLIKTVCDGERITQFYNEKSKSMEFPPDMPCRAIGNPACMRDGRVVASCPRCTASMSIYIQSLVGIMEVRSTSERDIAEIPAMLNNILEQFGDNATSVPLILTRVLQTCQKRMKDKETGEIRYQPGQDWFLKISIDPEYMARLQAARTRKFIQAAGDLEPPQAPEPSSQLPPPPAGNKFASPDKSVGVTDGKGKAPPKTAEPPSESLVNAVITWLDSKPSLGQNAGANRALVAKLTMHRSSFGLPGVDVKNESDLASAMASLREAAWNTINQKGKSEDASEEDGGDTED